MHPPTQSELETAAAGGEPEIEHLVGASGATAGDEDGRRGKRHKHFVAETPEALRTRAAEHMARSTVDEKRRQVTAGRASLPIAQFKQPILDAVAAAHYAQGVQVTDGIREVPGANGQVFKVGLVQLMSTKLAEAACKVYKKVRPGVAVV